MNHLCFSIKWRYCLNALPFWLGGLQYLQPGYRPNNESVSGENYWQIIVGYIGWFSSYWILLLLHTNVSSWWSICCTWTIWRCRWRVSDMSKMCSCAQLQLFLFHGSDQLETSFFLVWISHPIIEDDNGAFCSSASIISVNVSSLAYLLIIFFVLQRLEWHGRKLIFYLYDCLWAGYSLGWFIYGGGFVSHRASKVSGT